MYSFQYTHVKTPRRNVLLQYTDFPSHLSQLVLTTYVRPKAAYVLTKRAKSPFIQQMWTYKLNLKSAWMLRPVGWWMQLTSVSR